MISQTSEYALRAIILIASRPERTQTAVDVAKTTQVPLAYLAKILQVLTRAGIVKSQRGPNGGFTLKRSADKITVLDVVQAIDPVARITECPLGLDAHCNQLCALHRRLDDAAAAIEEAFRNTSIAELLIDPNPARMLGAAS